MKEWATAVLCVVRESYLSRWDINWGLSLQESVIWKSRDEHCRHKQHLCKGPRLDITFGCWRALYIIEKSGIQLPGKKIVELTDGCGTKCPTFELPLWKVVKRNKFLSTLAQIISGSIAFNVLKIDTLLIKSSYACVYIYIYMYLICLERSYSP